jgi:ParB family chromosome partitioning protein
MGILPGGFTMRGKKGTAKKATARRDVEQVVWLDVDDIRAWENQPRRIFDNEGINRLSISMSSHRQEESVEVIPLNTKRKPRYELTKGERRWRAAQIAGKKQIRAVVRTYETVAERLIAAGAENCNQEPLSMYELILFVGNLVDVHGVPLSQVASKVGVHQGTATKYLGIYKNLDNRVMNEFLHPDLPKNARINLEVADILSRVPRREQYALASKCAGKTARRARLTIEKATGALVDGPRAADEHKLLSKHLERIGEGIGSFLDQKERYFHRMFARRTIEDVDEMIGTVGERIEDLRSLITTLEKVRKKKLNEQF